VRDYAVEQRTIGAILADKAELHGDALFLRFGDDTYCYLDALERSRRAAAALLARGVGPGTHVAVMMDNAPEFLWVNFGLGMIGAVGVPINTAAKGQLLRYYVEDSGCTALVADSHHLPVLDRALGGFGRFDLVVAHGEPREGCAALADLLAEGDGLAELAPPAAVTCDQPWLIMFTGGTTGPSKGVVCPHAHPQTVARRLVTAWDLQPQDRMYTFLPLFHGNAFWYSCLTAIWAGASVALAPRFSASRFWDDVHRFGATEFNAMASVTKILEKMEPSPAEADNPLRLGFVVPLPNERAELERRWGLEFSTCFAMTELGPAAVLIPGDGHDRGGVAGTCDPGYLELRIVDELDREVEPGTPGQIVSRSVEPWTTLIGYHGKPEATATAMLNQWFHTGDRGMIDADGFVYFLDREKDAIRRRGENISAHEVERMLEQHEGVREVAAVPVPSELEEEDVGVYVVRVAGSEVGERELVEFAIEEMPYFMVPRYVGFVDELPKTDTHKVAKYRLRERVAAGDDALWDREAHGIVVKR
jgi:carnitine-CoA ligase